MTEPLYAYRSYAVYPNNLIHANSDAAALVPLFYKYTDTNGDATDSTVHGTARIASVSLFDWTTADEVPEMGDPDNWYKDFTVGGQYINLHDNGVDKGLYSFTTMEDAVNYIKHMGWKPTVLYAKVELAGVIVEHDLGYRAQMTRIVELFSDLSQSSRDLLAERLGWPFEIKDLPSD